MHSITLYGSKIQRKIENSVINPERNDVMMILWVCSVRSKDRIVTIKPKYGQQLVSIRDCSQTRQLLLFGQLERTEECSRSIKCRKLDDGSNLDRVRFTETWIKVIKRNINERKVAIKLVKNISAWIKSHKKS